MVNNIKALRSETELLLSGKMALVSWGAGFLLWDVTIVAHFSPDFLALRT